jgi:hypothetical protein
MAAREGEGITWSAELGNAVIHWAQARQDKAKCDVRRAALTAIERGEEVDRWLLREMVGERLVHVTTTKVIVTEEGRTFLDEDSFDEDPERRRPTVAGEQPSSRMASLARANGVATSGAPGSPALSGCYRPRPL